MADIRNQAADVTISEETLVQASPYLTFADLGGEAVILHVETGKYFGLNEVGADIFNAIQESVPVGRVVDELGGTYDVERSRLLEDVIAFVSTMHQAELVILGDAADRAA